MAKLNRDQFSQTDDEIEAIFDAEGHMLTADNLTYVSDTIPDFLAGREHWNCPGKIETQTDTLLVIEGVQPRAGMPRRTLIVADLGFGRAVYGA